MAKSKPSRNFQSYLELDDGIGNGVTPVETVPLEPTLLPGETMVAAADGVLLYLPMSEQRQGLSGRLHITNFKLSFVTLHSVTAGPAEEPWQNRLLGKHDVCLMNIDSIYQLSSNGKRKLLAPRSNVSGRVKELQIRCKDFRVITFSFRCTRGDEDRNITNALLLYCYPRQANLMFAFDYKGEAPEPAPVGEQQCCSEAGWTDLLTRSSSVGWRISHVNRGYSMCDSLPEVLVVPNGILDSQLLSVSGHYNGSRPPVWCWGSPDGGAIARSAYPVASGRHSQEAQLAWDAIKSSHPTYKDPIRLDVGVECPSIEEVQESYIRLREICSPESVRPLVETDGRFVGLLGASRWPSAVSRCLAAAARCVQTLTEEQTVVILTESTGRDLTAVVSCLAQLLVDADCRSLAGFQRLIQRQWVALGHPFQDRLGLLHRDGARKSAVFLLFLDCVHQLLVQFPARFEFTETLLVSLWDSLHVSVFDTFLFNSEKERADAVSAKEHDYPLRRRPVWHWAEQFNPEWRKLFTSAAHEAKLQLGLAQPAPSGAAGAARGPAGPGLSLLAAVASGGLAPPVPPPRRARRRADLLRPVTSVAAVRLWALCFCRWVPSLNVVSGGQPAEEACLRHVLGQLRTLEAQVESARDGVGVRRSARASARCSAAPASLPSAFHPFEICRSPTPLLCVTPGLVNALVRNSIVTGEDDGLAAHRGRQYGL